MSMKIVVQKFGGTSVSTKERRKSVIKNIKEAIKEGFSPVVVVSARGRKGEPYATDTLLSLVTEGFKEENKLAQFDYIVSNPPFKTDFSDYRDKLEDDKYSDRFFAGVPNIPNTKKDSMAIYLLFIQHILYSLKDIGKAAIVVPTGFLTAQSGIEKRLREYMINNKYLRGVISMPSNIFATTGTNVSIIFIDKSIKSDRVFLMDASNLGEKIKDVKNQRTILSKKEILKIESNFIDSIEEEDFSVLVSIDDIKEKNYSFSAGQYFEVKLEFSELTKEEFNSRVEELNKDINELLSANNKLITEVNNTIKDLLYEES